MNNMSAEKVVVIDGITTAMLVSVLFKDKQIDHLIIEQKQSRGNVTQWGPDSYEQLIIELLLINLKIKNRYVLTMPCIYYDNPFRLKGAVHLIQTKRSVYKNLKYYLGKDFRHFIYYGAITSSIISFINIKNIIQLDHGVEYFRRNSNNKSNFKEIIKNIWFNFLSMHDDKYIKRGYTFFSAVNDSFIHLSVKDVDTTYIEKFLNIRGFPDITTNDSIALYMPFSSFEYETYCFARNLQPEEYDSYCTYDYTIENAKKLKINKIFVKFHPGFISSKNEKLLLSEINKIRIACAKYKIKCYIIGMEEDSEYDFLKYIPSELISKLFNIKILLAHGSTSVFNLAEINSDIKAFLYLSILPSNYKLFFDNKMRLNPNIQYL